MIARHRALLSLAVLVTACVSDAAGPEVMVTSVSLSMHETVDTSFLHALSLVRLARLELSRDSVTTVSQVPVDVRDNRVSIRLRAVPPPGLGPIRVHAKLSSPAGTLFEGTGFADGGGAPRTVPITLTPVAAQITGVVTPTFSALGLQFQLQSEVRLASGDLWPGVEADWVSLTPDVVGILPGNVAESRGNGDASLVATFANVTRTISVSVRQVPTVLVGIAPADTTIAIGGAFPMRLVGEDSNGVPLLPGALATWGRTGGVTVNASGIVTGTALGAATVEAVSGALRQSTTVTVVP